MHLVWPTAKGFERRDWAIDAPRKKNNCLSLTFPQGQWSQWFGLRSSSLYNNEKCNVAEHPVLILAPCFSWSDFSHTSSTCNNKVTKFLSTKQPLQISLSVGWIPKLQVYQLSAFNRKKIIIKFKSFIQLILNQ